MSVPAVEATGLCHRFGDRIALDMVDVRVCRGEVVGLVGANGAGKTTTLRILSGLLRPSTGTVGLLGTSVEESLTRLGIVFEQPCFYPNMSAVENMDLALTFAGRTMSRSAVVGLLAKVGLKGQSTPVRGFSLGMKRRLALAVAISKNPSILLLDEPTNGLDIDGVELLCDIIREQAKAGVACLFSSHDWAVVERLVDKVVVLNTGRVAYSGPLEQLVAPKDRWKVHCPDGNAGSVLAGTPGVCIMQSTPDGHFVLELDGATITEVTKRMVAAGCTPEIVAPHRQSLLDIYRCLTGEGIR